MKYLLRFRKFSEYSLEEVEKQLASFGLYKCYAKQKELEGRVDSAYLNKKYGDDSLTDENAVNVMKKHIKNNYLLFCSASFDPMTEKRMKLLWRRYTKNDGFAILYRYDFICNFIELNRYKGTYNFKRVLYSDEKFDLTGYLDCFLESADIVNNSFNDTKFFKLLRKTGHNKDQIEFMRTKTKYKYSEEREFRIIKHVENDDAVINKHLLIPFVLPEKVYILNVNNSPFVKQLIEICKTKRIKYEIVERDQALVV